MSVNTIVYNFSSFDESKNIFSYGAPNGNDLTNDNTGGTWSWEDGNTPSRDTGPSSGYNLGYIYTEASSPTAGGDEFTIITNDSYDLSKATLKLSFMYNAHVRVAPEIEIYIWDGFKWVKEDGFKPDDLTDTWSLYELNINTYNNTDAKIKILMRIPDVSSIYRQDFGIDVFTVSLTTIDDPIMLYYNDYSIIKYKNDGIVFDGTTKTVADLESIINNFINDIDNYLFTNYPNGYIVYGPGNTAYLIKKQATTYIKYETDLVTISDAETIVGWSGNNLYIDRMSSMNKKFSVSSNTNISNNRTTYTPDTPVDISNNILRLWTLPSLFIYLKKTDSIRVELYDGAKTGYWDFNNSDNRYKGGWINAIIDTTKLSTDGIQLDMTNIVSIAVYYDYKITLDNKVNTWVDFIRTGTYARLSGTDITMLDALNIDNSESISFGMIDVMSSEDIYSLKGNLIIGNSIDTIYNEYNKIISFDESLAGIDNIYIRYTGNSNVSEITLDNVTFTSTSVYYELDASDSGLTKLFIINSSINNAKLVKLNSNYIITNIAYNVFNNCGNIYVNGSRFTNNTITNSGLDTNGVLIVDSDTTLNNAKNINFVNNKKYCIYVEANVTLLKLEDFIFDNPDGSLGCYTIYWAGTSGTLTVTSIGDTNIEYSGVLSAGGVIVINRVDSNDLSTVINKIDTMAADVRLIKVAQGENLQEMEETIYTASGVRLVL